MNIYEVVRRPIVTEKGLTKKESENTLCFEVNSDANKIHIKAAVEKLFKVKVADVQAAPSRPVRRVPLGLEEGLREIKGRREDAGIRRDLSTAFRGIASCQ